MYVGEGEAALQAAFTTARASAPAVLFIDEVDSIAGDDVRYTKTVNSTASTLNRFHTQYERPAAAWQSDGACNHEEILLCLCIAAVRIDVVSNTLC